MRTSTVVLAAAMALLAAPAVQAQRSPVPIIDRPDVAVVTGSGKPASLEDVKKAIINGGAAGARKWDIVATANGQSLRGTYKVRTHVIMVDIVPTAASFSVKYADSVNMKFKVEDGTPLIHPFYNRWVDELLESIRLEMRKL